MLAFLCGSPAAATDLRYTLALPDLQPIRYQLEFEVRHPGTLIVEGNWSGSRILAFQVKSPEAGAPTLRRSGPSPQRMEIDLEPASIVPGKWTLSIKGLAARQTGEGLLTIRLPDPAPPAAPRTDPSSRKAATPVEPWLISRRPPPGAGAPAQRFFHAVEQFRSHVAGSNERSEVDNCRWQTGLLRYLADAEDAFVSDAPHLEDSSRGVLGQLLAVLAEVEDLRTGKDPELVGPPPDERLARRIWSRQRNEMLRGVESRLDRILERLQRGHVPQLREQVWPVRLVSCIAASERHFKQRLLVGEARASNRDLAQAQWTPILSAGEALAALLDATRNSVR